MLARCFGDKGRQVHRVREHADQVVGDGEEGGGRWGRRELGA